MLITPNAQMGNHNMTSCLSKHAQPDMRTQTSKLSFNELGQLGDVCCAHITMPAFDLKK